MIESMSWGGFLLQHASGLLHEKLSTGIMARGSFHYSLEGV